MTVTDGVLEREGRDCGVGARVESVFEERVETALVYFCGGWLEVLISRELLVRTE